MWLVELVFIWTLPELTCCIPSTNLPPDPHDENWSWEGGWIRVTFSGFGDIVPKSSIGYCVGSLRIQARAHDALEQIESQTVLEYLDLERRVKLSVTGNSGQDKMAWGQLRRLGSAIDDFVQDYDSVALNFEISTGLPTDKQIFGKGFIKRL